MIVSVIYPKRDGSHFDMKYYLEKHVPLVQKLWGGAHGLKGARVLHGTASLGGTPDYEVIALLEFESHEAFLRAAGAHGDEIMGDIKHFTNVQPYLQLNAVVAG